MNWLKGTTTTTTKKEERRKHKLVKSTGETVSYERSMKDQIEWIEETTGAWRDEIKEDFGKTGKIRDGLVSGRMYERGRKNDHCSGDNWR